MAETHASRIRSIFQECAHATVREREPSVFATRAPVRGARMARKKKGGRRIKRKTQSETDTSSRAEDLPPRSFVFTKGKVPPKLKTLVDDLKRVMAPNTSQALRAQKRNKLRDFVDVAGSLHVNFFLIASATDKHSYLRLARAPRGPTLTFRIGSYSLSSDLPAKLRRPYTPSPAVWQNAPTLVLSNFDKSVDHQKLSATMLQNLVCACARRAPAARPLPASRPLIAQDGGGSPAPALAAPAHTARSMCTRELQYARAVSASRLAPHTSRLRGRGGSSPRSTWRRRSCRSFGASSSSTSAPMTAAWSFASTSSKPRPLG